MNIYRPEEDEKCPCEDCPCGGRCPCEEEEEEEE